MNEKEWDKLLNIRTSGRDDSHADSFRYPYEPTPYSVLERLAAGGSIRKNNTVIDYGCGKGRTAIFLSSRTGSRATGIEFDQELYDEAVKNLKQSKLPGAYKKGISFVCSDARNYQVKEENCFYFFNPFADDILKIVLGKIRQSFYENPRPMLLFFYYPYEAETAALMTADGLGFVDEIDCTQLFENHDRRERILIFEMG